MHLLSIDDLSDSAVHTILTRALDPAARTTGPVEQLPVVGLLFLSSSLRTKVGFAVAGARLGAPVVEASELRFGLGMSAGETLADTVRTLTGMVDVLVVRTPDPLAEAAATAVAPVVNAGDRSEHPTQALIDLLAMEEERGGVESLRVGLCGDMQFRVVRSLLKLFDRRPPARLVLIGPPGRTDHGVPLGPALEERTEVRHHMAVDDLDVLDMVGLPEGAGEDFIAAASRQEFALTSARLAELPADAVVLAPLPVIDEIDEPGRDDARVRMFQQSDRGVAVRMAVLEHVLRLAGTASAGAADDLVEPDSSYPGDKD